MAQQVSPPKSHPQKWLDNNVCIQYQIVQCGVRIYSRSWAQNKDPGDRLGRQMAVAGNVRMWALQWEAVLFALVRCCLTPHQQHKFLVTLCTCWGNTSWKAEEGPLLQDHQYFLTSVILFLFFLFQLAGLPGDDMAKDVSLKSTFRQPGHRVKI